MEWISNQVSEISDFPQFHGYITWTKCCAPFSYPPLFLAHPSSLTHQEPLNMCQASQRSPSVSPRASQPCPFPRATQPEKSNSQDKVRHATQSFPLKMRTPFGEQGWFSRQAACLCVRQAAKHGSSYAVGSCMAVDSKKRFFILRHIPT